jgi:hypothetical protein
MREGGGGSTWWWRVAEKEGTHEGRKKEGAHGPEAKRGRGDEAKR